MHKIKELLTINEYQFLNILIEKLIMNNYQ